MKKFIFLFISIVILGNNIYSQLQSINWIFGRPVSGSSNATLYFGNLLNPVVTLPTGQPDNITVNNGDEQWAVVSNPTTGKLLFYTDGQNVFDSLNNLVSSLNLGGNPSCSQPVAIAPVPNLNTDMPHYNQCYIFTNGTGSTATACDTGIVTYWLYNMNTHSFGTQTNLPGVYGNSTVTEGMVIVPCDNSSQIMWLIVSLYPDPGKETKYVVYKIFKNVVSYQGDFDFGPPKMVLPDACSASPIVFFTYSKANTSYGITNIGIALQYSSSVFTCQFDNINGQFLTSTARTCNTGYSCWPTVYNCEFSPNGRFLYYTAYATTSTTNELFQVDLQDTVLTPTLINSYPYKYAGGLKVGPDSLIYHIYDGGLSTNTIKLGRILQPNVKYIPGITNYSTFYEENFQVYNNANGYSLCEFLVMPKISTGIEEETMASGNISIYPNPATNNLTILAPQKSVIDINNIQGQLIKSISPDENNITIDISALPRGVYIINAKNEKGISVKKFVKE